MLFNLIFFCIYYILRKNSYHKIRIWEKGYKHGEDTYIKSKFPVWEAFLISLFIFVPAGFIWIIMLPFALNYPYYIDKIIFPKDSIWNKISKFLSNIYKRIYKFITKDLAK